MCWVPLLRYLGVQTIVDPVLFFKHDWLVAPLWNTGALKQTTLDRTTIEVLCGLRPELVDALWKCDMQWETMRVPHERQKEFIVTNNGSFHRKEVLDFLWQLQQYSPTKKKVVLVPCAADKPYPAPMHSEVLALMPENFYLMNATGVLGLVPQDLWSIMPHYDSGLPNEWRLFNTVKMYFSKHHHEQIVVYCDYYNEAIYEGLRAVGQLDRTTFVNEVKFYADYLNLLEPARLAQLKSAINFSAYIL